MNVYIARSPEGTRFRVKQAPFRDGELPGWGRRSGTMPDEKFRATFEAPLGSITDVELEAAHQELWLALTPV